MSDYFTPSGVPATGAALSSSAARGEFANVGAGFVKIAPYTGHASEFVTINAGATGQTSLSASDARTALALAIGTNVQAWDADLDAIAGLTSAANKGIMFTGSHTAATFDLTAAGLALLDDASASAQRTTLGLGTMATQASGAVAITGGTITGVTIGGFAQNRATADQSVSSGSTGTSLTDATSLGFAIAANEEWIAEFWIDVGAGLQTTGVKVAITGPSGSTLNIVAECNEVTNAGTRKARTVTSGATLDFTFVSLGGDEGFVHVSVWVLNSTNAGTVQLQFAQSTSSATNTTIRKGSHFTAKMLP